VILLVGVLLGLVAGYIRARVVNRPFIFPEIKRAELVLLAFLPQALIFFVPQTGRLVSQQWAALILPISLGVLVVFFWFNRRLQGFGLLGLGLLLNLAVIAANGGLMPISPETLRAVHGSQIDPVIGSHAVGSKNIVLPVEETRLEWLGDRFTVPDRLPIQFAYSLGDLFLAVGAFWVLWTGGTVRHRAANAFIDRQTYSSQS
jgi:hypothetical protein